MHLIKLFLYKKEQMSKGAKYFTNKETDKHKERKRKIQHVNIALSLQDDFLGKNCKFKDLPKTNKLKNILYIRHFL